MCRTKSLLNMKTKLTMNVRYWYYRSDRAAGLRSALEAADDFDPIGGLLCGQCGTLTHHLGLEDLPGPQRDAEVGLV